MGGRVRPRLRSSLCMPSSCNGRYRVAYPIEFLCLSLALLMVLDRMFKFSTPVSPRCARAVVAVVAACIVAGLCGSFVSAAQHVETSVYWRKTSVALASNDTFNLNKSRDQARALTELSASTASVYFFSEAVALLIIIACFSFVGIVTSRRVSIMLKAIRASSAAATAGKKLHTNVTVTTTFIFLTFLLRFVYSFMFALAHALQDSSASCSSPVSSGAQNYCSQCFNTCACPCPIVFSLHPAHALPSICFCNVLRRCVPALACIAHS
jgi:hypothetical protein